MIHRREITPEDRPRMISLLESIPAFTAEEREVALELVDAAIARPDAPDYRFILAVEEGEIAGFVCFGPTPMTEGTFDLYWLATSPAYTRSGVARGLVAEMEIHLADLGARLVRVETGSREGHDAAHRFYDALGFARTAVIPDFYAAGDDLIIFTKRLSAVPAPTDADSGDAGLYDAAFGYRDWQGERDFLLACARRFGDGAVRRVMQWACGPARHLAAFSELGIQGVGVDGSAEMLEYARRVLNGRADVELLRAELWQHPGVAGVDLAFLPLSSVHVLLTPGAMAEHLAITASCLRPGGLYVIEATHPADATPSGVHHTEWTEVRGDHLVDARFRMHIERVNAARVLPVTLEVQSGKGDQRRSLVQQGEWFIPDLDGWRAIVERVERLERVAELGDFNVDVPFDHPSAWRLMLVLRRR